MLTKKKLPVVNSSERILVPVDTVGGRERRGIVGDQARVGREGQTREAACGCTAQGIYMLYVFLLSSHSSFVLLQFYEILC